MCAMSAVGVGMGLRYEPMPIESTVGPTAERPPTTTFEVESSSVVFRDDSEAYNHYANGNWGDIVGVVRSAVVNSAL